MADRPVILVHGYSDDRKGFDVWRSFLSDANADAVFDVRVSEYKSLTNEIGIKDIAEAFDRALRLQAGLTKDEEFDAVVHSTGMLVVRSWLTTYPTRKDRLKHLVALAPATWGSPLAHKGRSWLGSVAKGSKNPFKPDFLEAGNEVLHGLELASSFTWDLAHRDLFGEEVYYGKDKRTPYVFVFCGNKPYGGIRELVTEPGTDGTVRMAGASLNNRKAVVDLTEQPDSRKRTWFTSWHGVSEIPVILIDGLDHSTIMKKPTEDLVRLVRNALLVKSEGALKDWVGDARKVTAESRMKKKYQQFVVRVVDERGDPIPDYNVRLYEGGKELRQFTADVHPYSRDKSLRNFHVDVTDLVDGDLKDFRMQIMASSGTDFVRYVGYSGGGKAGPAPTVDIDLDLTPLTKSDTKFFFPFTTTAVEIKLNREPWPLGKESDLCRILPGT